jgi:hypothetical protein
LVGVLSGLFIEAFELFISQPLLAGWMGKMPDLSNFTAVHSNLKLTLIYLVLIWGLAAFGEELVYRGYLMTRLAGLLRGTRAAWVISLVIISIVFGCSHTGQGATGMLENVWDGLLLGTVYLACGRNLTAAIVAHGVTGYVRLERPSVIACQILFLVSGRTIVWYAKDCRCRMGTGRGNPVPFFSPSGICTLPG